MSRVKEAVDHGISEAKAAGLKRVTGRLEDINPPCVWVAAEGIEHQLGADSLDVTVAFFLIPGGADEYRALAKAGEMLDDLLSSGFSPGETSRPVQVRPTETSAPLAAIRTATTYYVTKE